MHDIVIKLVPGVIQAQIHHDELVIQVQTRPLTKPLFNPDGFDEMVEKFGKDAAARITMEIEHTVQEAVDLEIIRSAIQRF